MGREKSSDGSFPGCCRKCSFGPLAHVGESSGLKVRDLHPYGQGRSQMGCLGVSSLCPLVELLKSGEASTVKRVVLPIQAFL